MKNDENKSPHFNRLFEHDEQKHRHVPLGSVVFVLIVCERNFVLGLINLKRRLKTIAFNKELQTQSFKNKTTH